MTKKLVQLTLIVVCIMTNLIFGQEKVKDFTKKEKKEIKQELVKKMKEAYVFYQKAEEVEKLVFSKKYSSNPYKFAAELQEDVRGITHDLHLSIRYNPNPQPEREERPEITPEEWAKIRKAREESLKQQNYNFNKVEILPGNFGYIQFSGFIASDGAFRAAAAAMQFVENTNAVIIDVRRNGGGDGRMGHFLATYFFEDGDQKWLLSNYNRKSDKLVQEWIMPTVPGKRLSDKPLYILVSGSTFSAAEAFPYAMQAYKRAIVVGDTTGGGAHSVGTVQLVHGISMGLPSGRVTSPVTETNWEGTGVIPDVPCDADKAIETAQLHYYTEKLKNCEVDKEKQSLEMKIQEMKAYLNPVILSEQILKNYAGEYLVENFDEKIRVIGSKDGKLTLDIVDNGSSYGARDLLTLSETLFKYSSSANIEFADMQNDIPQTIYWVRPDGSKEKWVRKN